MSRGTDHSSLCPYHAGWLTEKKPTNLEPQEDFSAELLGPLADLRTAAGINYALGKLVLLVASNRIPPRQANSIGFLLQLMHQTLRGVVNEMYKAQIDRTNKSDDLRRILAQTATLVEK
jgi:hypothetical protein